MNKFIAKIIFRTSVFLHNFSYRLISKAVIILEGGLHPKHRIMNYHQFFVDNISRNDSVLDIGCGIGSVAYDIAKKAKKVIGIDISKKSIQSAKQKYCKNNLTFICGDATKYHFNEKFSIIVLSNVLEHIQKREFFLKKLRPLSPIILIRVPLITRGWLPSYLKERKLEYRLDKTHFTEYTEISFQKEIDQSGFIIKNSKVIWGELWAVVLRKGD